MTRRDHLIALAFIAAITLFLAVTVLFTQSIQSLLIFDANWYANRADQLWRGYLGDAFVYTLGYPFVVSIVNLLVNDVVNASFIVNIGATFGMFVGMYGLAIRTYNRTIGLIAILLLAMNPAFYPAFREIQPPTLFYFCVVWCALLYHIFTEKASIGWGIALSLMVAAATYTRLEGVIFGLLILIALGQIFYHQRSIRQVIRLGAASLLPVGIAVLFFVYVLLSGAETGTGGGFALIDLMQSAPIRWDLLSRRVQNTLIAISQQWELWLLVFSIGMMALVPDKFSRTNLAVAGFIAYYAFSVFILTIWPFPLRAQFANPFIALLAAWALWRIGQLDWLPYAKKLWGVLVILAIIPGIATILQFVETPPFAFREADIPLAVARLDDWIMQQGWADDEFYTFCERGLPFTRLNFHSLFQLQIGGELAYSHPRTLLKNMAENGDYLIRCEGQRIEHTHWQAYFANPGAYDYALEQVAQFEDYLFFQAVPHDD